MSLRMKTTCCLAALLSLQIGWTADAWFFDNCSKSDFLHPFVETNLAERIHGLRIADADTPELYGYWQRTFPTGEPGTYHLTFKLMTADMAVGVWVPTPSGDYTRQIPAASGERHRRILAKFIDEADLQTFSDREWRDFACDVEVKKVPADQRLWIKLGTMGGSAGWMKFKDVRWVRKEGTK